MKRTILLLLLWVGMVCGRDTEAGEIVALCIGNNAYSREEDVLDTPVNDARLMHRTLSAVPGVEAGDVVLLEDARRNQITLALRQFKARARKAKLALVFYSGHGVEDRPEGYDRGETFLLPVDAAIESVDELPDKAVPLKTVLEAMEGNRGMARVVILDCCRTGAPSAKRLLGRAGKDQENLDERVKKALGSAVVPEGTLIAFATSPGRKAAAFLKESDSNSPFTRFVCEQMESRGGDLFSIVREATRITKERTAMRQVPHVELRGDASLITDYEIPKRAGNGKDAFAGTEEERKRLEIAKLGDTRPGATVKISKAESSNEILQNGAVGKVLAFSLSGNVELKMCYVPPGKFTMGSPKSESGRNEDENQVEVTISQGFWMGQTELTQEQWEAVMGSHSNEFQSRRNPVERVSWRDAQRYVEGVNKHVKLPAGWRFALPTEAQWEYACRSGNPTAYAFGKTLGKAEANIESQKTVEVMGYMPNSWGLYDMHGNVWEWCADLYREQLQPGTDPVGAAESGGTSGQAGYRVLRGGSWNSNFASLARCARRISNDPDAERSYYGFRLALVPNRMPVLAESPKPTSPPTPAFRPESDSIGGLENGAVGKVVSIPLSENVALKMCYVPPGKFTMGSPKSESGRNEDEKQVEVTISRGFWMAQTEMTQEQWEAVMGSNTSESRHPRNPVDMVSWENAQGCVARVNKKLKLPGGWRFGLPTEAQWEYACRAGTTTAYAFGETLSKAQANVGSGKLVEVGRYAPNKWGLYDMHGNVFEWCADWLGESLPGGVDPKGVNYGIHRVLRGGSWCFSARFARCAQRRNTGPDFADFVDGFRLVLCLP